jgi:hypothetical protein
MTAKYNFEPLGGSPEDGVNDPLKTLFGISADAVIREAFQNSIDAANDKEKPVKVSISLKKWQKNNLPNADQFKDVVKACRDATQREGNESFSKHYENALKILNEDELKVLVISDTNTTGLTGSDSDTRGNFYKFFKSVGGHAKAEGSAGSYGFGKSTNIVFSAIDTFFASSVTVNKDTNTFEHVFMGSVRVCSHEINDVKMRGIGSYSLPGQLPIRDKSKIPAQFLREDDPGTTLFIPAYKDADSWKEITIRAALKNFWLAIHKGKLEVEVIEDGADPIFINISTLENLIQLHFQTKGPGAAWKKDSPLPFYKAYLEGKQSCGELDRLNSVECYLLPGNREISPDYIACFRKNLMLIQHIRFKSIIPYSGVFICTSDEGNKILQKMEPPQHDSWDPNIVHAKDDNGKPLKECVEADREYRKFIVAEIHKLLGSRTVKKLELNSLNDRIFINQPQNNHGASAGDVVEEGNQSIEPLDNEAVVKSSSDQKATRLPSRAVNVSNEGNVPSRKKTKKDSSKKQERKNDPDVVGELDAFFRQVTYNNNGVLETKIIIRTTANKNVKIRLKAGTQDGTQNIGIKSTSAGRLVDDEGKSEGEKSCITGIRTDEIGEAVIIVKFDENKKYSLTADFYETK